MACHLCDLPMDKSSNCFCLKHQEEFNAWYRLGLHEHDNWVWERQKRGLLLGVEAISEFVEKYRSNSIGLPCAICDHPILNRTDYLCTSCRA